MKNFPFALAAACLALPASAQTTARVNLDSGGAQGDGHTGIPTISADGRFVAFESLATNFVAGDTNAKDDVFVRDRWTGTTERISVDSSEAQSAGDSYMPSISADGRYVAFYSFAGNLVAGDTNGTHDVFVRDRLLGTTERVSVDSAEAQGNSDSVVPQISGDGRYVTFYSFAGNLVAGDTNANWDVFVRDLVLGTTERVSVDTAGVQGNGMSSNPAISGDGRFVVFTSSATNLVAGDTNAVDDVFVRDRMLDTTIRASVGAGGAQSNGGSDQPTISDNGIAAFWSSGSNLVLGDTNGTRDQFVRDLNTATTERVSVATGGGQANFGAEHGRISSTGRFVAFTSTATDLVVGDLNGFEDAFLRDRQLGTTELVSVATGGAQGNSFSFYPVPTPNGRFVAFGSLGTNLVAGDTNAVQDVFLRDRDPAGFTSFCHPGSGGVVPCPCGNPPSGAGRGCQNHGTMTGGATIAGSGLASLGADSVVLSATGENATSLTVFWTGSVLLSPGVAHAAGVRCAQSLHRLYNGNASGGAIARPGGSDPSVSARSATVGAPITAGQTRYYFTIYRDPQAAVPCGSSASTINLSNAAAVTWAP